MELFCPEDGSRLAFSDEEDDSEKLSIFPNSSLFSQAEDECFRALISNKKTFLRSFNPFSSDDNLHRERFESVRWILKMYPCFGFGSQTAYLAVTFLDRFILRRNIDEGKVWAMKLLTIACLSLAAKMEESSPPFLPAYKYEDHRFSSAVIQRMELLVLDTMEWRLNSKTPFSYLGYFASKFQFDNRLLSRAIEFIFIAVEAMNLINFMPLTIAVAAILAASGDELMKKLTEITNYEAPLNEFTEIEDLFTCYNSMIRESKKKMRFQKDSSSSNISSNSADLKTLRAFINIVHSSARSHKRRRLL